MCLKDLRDEFIYDCECRHLAKGSLRNYKAATRFLLEYLEERDNPAKKVECLRQPRTIIDSKGMTQRVRTYLPDGCLFQIRLDAFSVVAGLCGFGFITR